MGSGDSFARHLQRSRELGLRTAILRTPGLGFDLDLPSDYAELSERGDLRGQPQLQQHDKADQAQQHQPDPGRTHQGAGQQHHRLKDQDIVEHMVELIEKKAAEIEAAKASAKVAAE